MTGSTWDVWTLPRTRESITGKTFCFRSLSSTSKAMAMPNFRKRMSSRPARMCGGNTLRGRRKMSSHRLSTSPPGAESPAFDEYVSDPAKPVPFVNYAALNVPQEYMLSDQRFADSRTDVAVYETPALQEDVTIAGPISPRLFVSTSGTDSDWDVK